MHLLERILYDIFPGCMLQVETSGARLRTQNLPSWDISLRVAETLLFSTSSAWHTAWHPFDILGSQVPLNVSLESVPVLELYQSPRRVSMLHLGLHATRGCLHSRELLLQGRLVDRHQVFLELQWIMRRKIFIKSEEDSISLSRKTSTSGDLFKKMVFVLGERWTAKIHHAVFLPFLSQNQLYWFWV